MHVELNPADATFLKECVAKGYYRDETDAMQYIIARMRDDIEVKRTRLYAALQKGMDSIKAGRVKPYTPELRQEMWNNAMSRSGSVHELDPDVIG